MVAIIIAASPDSEHCCVAVRHVDHHRQAVDLIEMLGAYPEALAWQIAARVAKDRGLPIAGPQGVMDTMRT